MPIEGGRPETFGSSQSARWQRGGHPLASSSQLEWGGGKKTRAAFCLLGSPSSPPLCIEGQAGLLPPFSSSAVNGLLSCDNNPEHTHTRACFHSGRRQTPVAAAICGGGWGGVYSAASSLVSGTSGRWLGTEGAPILRPLFSPFSWLFMRRRLVVSERQAR